MNAFCLLVVASLLASQRGLTEDTPTIASDGLLEFFQAQPRGTSRQVFVRLAEGSSGISAPLPVHLLKGAYPGPRFALTAAIHGDEVTGVPVVQHVLKAINVDHLKGDIIAIPVLNPFGFARVQRGGFAGKDINRSFLRDTPIGEEMFYAAKLFRMLSSLELDYHADLHTATAGNGNSFYVRADLLSPESDLMARVLQPQIILNTTRPDRSLRAAMASIGVSSVTVEMGGPNKVNERFVQRGVDSLLRLMQKLEMIDDAPVETNDSDTVVCSSSKWVCSTHGGLVYQAAEIMSMVTEGDRVAEIRDVFGNFVANIAAPHSGIVIGNTERLSVAYGARLVHIGRIAERIPYTVH